EGRQGQERSRQEGKRGAEEEGIGIRRREGRSETAGPGGQLHRRRQEREGQGDPGRPHQEIPGYAGGREGQEGTGEAEKVNSPEGGCPTPPWIPPDRADEDGFVGIGGDLRPACLLRAYREGVFPWYSEGEPILWWSPDPRAIFEIDALY